MPAFHSVYGLYLRSDLPVPGLPVLPAAARPDVRLRLGSKPRWLSRLADPQEVFYRSSHQGDRGVPLLTVRTLASHSYFQFLYSDGTEFILDRRGTQIWATWREGATLEDTATYLVGPVLGFLLRLRGTTCLHASAIAMGDRALAFLGGAGAGKSTTAAVFARKGYPVLSDDVVALVDRGNEFFVQPAYPRLCLWPDAVRSLYASPEALPPLTPTWDKRYLDLTGNGYRFQQGPLPLAGIYFLGQREGGPAPPRVQAVAAGAGLMDLVANSYVNYLLDRRMRAEEFDVLGRLAAHIPLRHVRAHEDPAYLEELSDVILHDFRVVAAPLLSRT